jgi:hypothetical protein
VSLIALERRAVASSIALPGTTGRLVTFQENFGAGTCAKGTSSPWHLGLRQAKGRGTTQRSAANSCSVIRRQTAVNPPSAALRMFLGSSRYPFPLLAAFSISEYGTTGPCIGATVATSSLRAWICFSRFAMKMGGRTPDGAGTCGVSGV